RHAGAIEKSAPFVVVKVERKKLKKNPPPPFITSSMQLEASRKLGFSARKTMQIAQQLYEGVELGEKGPVGLITYMRTDSVRVADVARASAKKFIREKFGKEYVGNIVYRTKKSAQDAHEAIRPTYIQNTPDSVKPYLTPDQYKLYRLIWERFLASQMAPAQLERTSVALSAGDYLAETSSTKVLFEGFLRLWKVRVAEDEKEEKVKLPELAEGDEVALRKI
ncbi:DNA topoisomerase I, partial [bacterium]|nr:DNA topoisomerase I [bacterium]